MSVEFDGNGLGTVPEDTPQVEITVYSYGGCTTCGNSMWNWFRNQNLKIDHHNVQVDYERREATELAMAQGIEVRGVSFPLMVVGGKVIVGFKPYELLEEINKLREGTQ